MDNYANQAGMISIIMPAYNVESYIARGIISCLRQTYTNWELLIIDDGSRDQTAYVAQRYAEQDARVHLYRQVNGGVSVARNHGIMLAQGEYVVFLDADDWLRGDALALLIGQQAAHPELLIAANRIYVDEQDYDATFPSNDDGSMGYLPADEQCVHRTVLTRLQSLQNSGMAPYNTACSGKLLRMDILQDGGIRFDPSIQYAEDGLFVFRYLLAVNGMLQCGDSIGRILERTGSATRVRFSRQHLSAVAALERMRQDARQAHEAGTLSDTDYEAVDASLQSYGGEQAYNNCRRYHDSGMTDPEIAGEFKRYLHRYSAAYCRMHDRSSRIKYLMMEYIPASLYALIYQSTHH